MLNVEKEVLDVLMQVSGPSYRVSIGNTPKDCISKDKVRPTTHRVAYLVTWRSVSIRLR